MSGLGSTSQEAGSKHSMKQKLWKDLGLVQDFTPGSSGLTGGFATSKHDTPVLERFCAWERVDARFTKAFQAWANRACKQFSFATP